MERKKIVLEIVNKNPGIRFNEIMQLSNIKNGTLSHYVKKLEDEKSIESERSPRVTRLYPAGIGENASETRKLVVDRLKALEVELDYERNLTRGEEKVISKESSKIKLLLIPTNEEVMIVSEKGILNTLPIDALKTETLTDVSQKIADTNLLIKQLFFLGLADQTLINKGLCSAAEVLQFIIEKRWELAPNDQDMVLMIHEIEYILD